MGRAERDGEWLAQLLAVGPCRVERVEALGGGGSDD